MTRRCIRHRHGTTLGWVLLGTLAATVALAQGPGGGPPPFGRPDWGPPPPPPASAVNAPLALLSTKLKLTADQTAKITQLQNDFRQQRLTLLPRFGPRPDGQPPDREAMQTKRDNVRVLDETASQKITALLTADQRKVLPMALAETDALRADDIPPPIYSDLKLTAAQEEKLTAIGQVANQSRKQAMDNARTSGNWSAVRDAMRQSRQQTDDKVAAVLTDAQRQILDKFRQEHPQHGRGMGGPGGGPGFGGLPDGNGPPPPNF